MMVAVAIVGLYLWLLCSPFGLIALVAGPFLCAVFDRAIGGSGVVGGTAGGLVAGLGVVLGHELACPIYPRLPSSTVVLAYLVLGGVGMFLGWLIGKFGWTTSRAWAGIPLYHDVLGDRDRDEPRDRD
jgi:hypothetical protein